MQKFKCWISRTLTAFILLYCTATTTVYAQIASYEQDEKDAIYDSFVPIFTHHVGTISLLTNGWNIMYEYGFAQNPRKKHLLSLTFSVLNDPKERTIRSEISFNGNTQLSSHVYGKQNIVYPLRLAYGQQLRLGLPNAFRGVDVNGFWKSSLNLAVVRPYVLTVVKRGVVDDFGFEKIQNITYSAQDSLLFLSINNIVQHAGFSSGWDACRVIPGLGLEVGLRLNIGPAIQSQQIIGVETSALVDIYTNHIPILAPLPNVKHSFFFIQGKIAFLFGAYNKRSSNKRQI